MNAVEGFPPIEAPDARVLILGSIPSAESLRRGEYYGHPRNAFWPLMARLFWKGRELPYAQRCAALRAHRIALWDVLRACTRPGSLDGNIVGSSERANDFPAFFAAHPLIRAVFFNGAKAEQSFRRRVLPVLERPPTVLIRLPSTSPAMASLRFEQKLEAWRRVARGLEILP